MKTPTFRFTRIIPLVFVLLALAAPVAGPVITGANGPNGNVSAQEVQDRDDDQIADADDLCPDDPTNQREAAQPSDQSSDVQIQQDESPPEQEPLIVDSDSDSLADDVDECPEDPYNQCNVPAPPHDSDADGFADVSDNCPSIGNPDQLDSDGDSVGNSCDESWQPDPSNRDADSVPDESDNCPDIANLDQTDSDQDGVGDICSLPPVQDTQVVATLTDQVTTSPTNTPTAIQNFNPMLTTQVYQQGGGAIPNGGVVLGGTTIYDTDTLTGAGSGANAPTRTVRYRLYTSLSNCNSGGTSGLVFNETLNITTPDVLPISSTFGIPNGGGGSYY